MYNESFAAIIYKMLLCVRARAVCIRVTTPLRHVFACSFPDNVRFQLLWNFAVLDQIANNNFCGATTTRGVLIYGNSHICAFTS